MQIAECKLCTAPHGCFYFSKKFSDWLSQQHVHKLELSSKTKTKPLVGYFYICFTFKQPQAVLLTVEEKVLMYIIVTTVLAEVWTAESLDPNADTWTELKSLNVSVDWNWLNKLVQGEVKHLSDSWILCFNHYRS